MNKSVWVDDEDAAGKSGNCVMIEFSGFLNLFLNHVFVLNFAQKIKILRK